MVLFGLLFPMDGSRVIESLGSLWFLTNIFLSKNKSLDSTSDGIATQERINNESSKEESTEPISPVLQNQPNELPNDENLNPMRPKCSEFVNEIEPQIANPVENEVMELKMSAEKEERRKTRRSKRGLNHRRNILGEWLESNHTASIWWWDTQILSHNMMHTCELSMTSLGLVQWGNENVA